MDRNYVSSSNLKSVGYDTSSRILEIEFNSGGIYQYFDVPENIYSELMSASSLGEYHARYIKGTFRYNLIS